MTTVSEKLSGLGLRPALMRGVSRFPIAVLFAALATIVMLSTTTLMMSDSAMALPRIYIAAAAVAGYVAALTAALVAERLSWREVQRQMISALAGAIAFAIAWLFREAIDLQPWLYVPALVALLTLAGTAVLGPGDSAFWRFNHDLWVGAAIALVAVVLLAGGLSAIIATSGHLLGTPWSGAIIMRLWTVALGFVGPIIWLTQVPVAGGPAEGEGYAAGLISTAIEAIVTYILAPLQLVYAVVLHIYAAKIALAGKLPDGQLGWMVLLYGVTVVMTALLGFSSREGGRSWMRLYWRIWPWILAVPAVLLWLAIFERIAAYGWTEQRYLIVLFGIWLVLVILTQGLPTPLRSIRMIPALAGVLALIASFGPWGVTGFPERMAEARIIDAFREAGVLGPDGRATAWPDMAKVAPETQRMANAGLEHLVRRERIQRLKPLFAALSDTPFGNTSLNNWALGDVLRMKLTLTATMPSPIPQSVGFYTHAPLVTDRPAGVRLVGPFVLDETTSQQSAPAAEGDVVVSLAGGVITVRERTPGPEAKFDLGRDPVLQAGLEQQNQAGFDITRQAPLVLKRSSGALDADILLVQAWGQRDESGTTKFVQAGVWVLIGKTTAP